MSPFLHRKISEGKTNIVIAAISLPIQEIRIGFNQQFFAQKIFYLAGVHNDMPMQDCLKLGVATSAMCLQAASSSEGVKSVDECLAFAEKYGFRKTT